MSRIADIEAKLRSAPRRWVVTGAAGFIGSALVERLLELGQGVVGVDNFITGHRHNVEDVSSRAQKPDQFRFIEGDLRDPQVCRAAVEGGTDVILHQAALGSVPRSIDNPLATHEHNVNAFLNILIAARDAKVRRVVYASSSSVYGDHPALPKSEDAIGAPLSPYAASKRIDEVYAGVFAKVYGSQLVGLRYFNVFGRRQDPNGPYAAVIPRWIDLLSRGEACTIFGDGSHSRDFCYVDNVVQANILAGTVEGAHEQGVYNVGAGGNTDLRTLFALLKRYIAESVPAVAGAEPLFAPIRAGDVPHSQASIERIQTALGYHPTHEVEAGLAETVRWFLARR